jgi:hypothetical protein
MRTKCRCIVALAAAWLASSPCVAQDSICHELREFERATFDASVQPVGRRWIEMHWRGHWLDLDKGWGLECRSSPDQASRRLCGWLEHHTSFEFTTRLPQRILTCYGYRFRPLSDWSGWKSDISVLNHNRWLLLEVDFLTMKNEDGAIRLSSFAKGQDDAMVEMPPLAEIVEPPRK